MLQGDYQEEGDLLYFLSFYHMFGNTSLEHLSGLLHFKEFRRFKPNIVDAVSGGLEASCFSISSEST